MTRLEYEVQTPKSVVESAKTWCHEQWGERWDAIDNRSGTWSVFWAGRGIPGHYRWTFATKEQAVLFTLRWKS